MDKTLDGTEELAGAAIRKYSIEFFEKLRKIHRKIPVLESHFNVISGLETCNFIKK